MGKKFRSQWWPMVGPRRCKAWEKYSLTAKVLRRPENIVPQVRTAKARKVYGIALYKVPCNAECLMEKACGAG